MTSVVYLHVILFRIHERDTAAEKELDTVLLMKLEHVLTQRFKQTAKWTAKVKVCYVNAKRPGNSSYSKLLFHTQKLLQITILHSVNK